MPELKPQQADAAAALGVREALLLSLKGSGTLDSLKVSCLCSIQTCATSLLLLSEGCQSSCSRLPFTPTKIFFWRTKRYSFLSGRLQFINEKILKGLNSPAMLLVTSSMWFRTVVQTQVRTYLLDELSKKGLSQAARPSKRVSLKQRATDSLVLEHLQVPRTSLLTCTRVLRRLPYRYAGFMPVSNRKDATVSAVLHLSMR
eukprot:3688444-Pleurochrysis_carterae.AAC.1